ncbi:hypothetical protein BU15DRAFT_74834 [Melanogaster broomeanus]|nr:hypothetical protein BU15DRAFT_74834 [Melanogaster broomeanus]
MFDLWSQQSVKRVRIDSIQTSDQECCWIAVGDKFTVRANNLLTQKDGMDDLFNIAVVMTGESADLPFTIYVNACRGARIVSNKKHKSTCFVILEYFSNVLWESFEVDSYKNATILEMCLEFEQALLDLRPPTQAVAIRLHNSLPFTMLSSLSAELMETVFDEFDVPSLLRCLQVCKLFHAIISQSTRLLYKIELFGSQMVDGRNSGLDIANRSGLLGSYNQVWREMRWAGYKEVPMESHLSWDLIGGILAHASFDTHSISFVQLPCSIKGIPEKQWTVHLGEVEIRDFYFDVAQDLLVCIEMIDEDICGPHVVILFQDSTFRASSTGDFMAWDWRTGEQQMFIQCAELRSFSMLTEDLILAATVPTRRKPSLDVISISECRRKLAATPNYSPLQFADIPCICRFQLPRIRGSVQDMFIRSEPSPLSTPPPGLGVPFSTSQGDCLYAMTLRFHDIHFSLSAVLMAFRSTFLARAIRNHGGDDNVTCGIDTTSYLDGTVPTNPSQVIPWRDWGPASTRILPLEPSDSWFCYVHGTKYIHPTSRNTADLYDFNPYAVRRYRLPPKSPEAAHDSSMWTPLEFESNIWSELSPFVADVTTRLPGSVAHVELQELSRTHSIPRGPFAHGRSLGPMLAEDHIVVAAPCLTWSGTQNNSFVYFYM